MASDVLVASAAADGDGLLDAAEFTQLMTRLHAKNNGSACSDDDGDTTSAWSSNSPTSDVSSPESTTSGESELAYYFDGDDVLSFDESKVMMNAASYLCAAAATCVQK
ncbi:putative calcium-binding protein CML19 [Miscanthus floridulus]|uniref:putative calcium-binding protein CML19 n=1 Tax=Miscanthus floridulus TaxID=154761 RepID=UPI0034576EF0